MLAAIAALGAVGCGRVDHGKRPLTAAAAM